jgi:hypothetical protein
MAGAGILRAFQPDQVGQYESDVDIFRESLAESRSLEHLAVIVDRLF